MFYGVNRAFQSEATKLLRDYVVVIASMLGESQARGELYCDDVEAMALMILSLTEFYVLSARLLGQPKLCPTSNQRCSTTPWQNPHDACVVSLKER